MRPLLAAALLVISAAALKPTFLRSLHANSLLESPSPCLVKEKPAAARTRAPAIPALTPTIPVLASLCAATWTPAALAVPVVGTEALLRVGPESATVLELIMLAGVIAAYTISAALARAVKEMGWLSPGPEASFADDSTRPEASLPADRPPALNWLAGKELPPLSELASACIEIASTVAVHPPRVQPVYLCLEPNSSDCTADADFSEYYGRPVYLCQA